MSFSLGENVGRYRLTEQLGQGGMATVYRAYDANLDRDVAIKVLHEAFNEDPAFLTRFKREAQIVARLRHPHLVTIHEFAEHRNRPYLVMEFIEGETLKAQLIRAKYTLNDTLNMMRPVSEALTYAHDSGILHRDIKPSNILISKTGIPYITDFGLARMVQAGESTLSQDMMLGTPQYISPEQAQGIRELGPATDIYSLGIVLYQMIVGRVPFSADTPYAIVHDHIYKPLPLPSDVNPAVPPELERILLKALAKEPKDRYQSAIAMFRDLEEGISGTAVASQSLVEHALPEDMLQPTLSPAIPAVRSADDPFTPVATPTEAASHKRTGASLWVIGGLGAFACVCIVALFVAVSAMADLDQRPDGRPEPPPASSVPSVADIPNLAPAEARLLVEQNPQDAVAQFALALALLRTDQRLLAQDAFQDAMNLSNNQPELVALVAREAAASGYWLEALQLFAEAIEQSDNMQVRNQAGAFMYEFAVQAELRQIAALSRLVESRAESAGLHAILARAHITVGQMQRASDTLDIALALDGTLPESHLILGDLYAAQGKPEEALLEWRFAATAADSPPWLIDTASNLIAQHGG